MSDASLRVELKRADVRELVAADPVLAAAQVLQVLGPRADEVLRAGTARRYADQAALFTQEEEGCSLFFVLKGEVKLLRLASKEQIELGQATRGDVLGERELLRGTSPRWCSASARGPVDAVELPREALLQHGAVPLALATYLRAVQQEREKACDALAEFLNRW